MTHLETGCFSAFICPGFKKESNMDGWKYVSASGRKESGFENLKTRFQDCNLSRKQESKLDGMIESKQSAKKTNCLCGMNENKEARKVKKKSFSLSCFQFGTKANHPSIGTDGMK